MKPLPIGTVERVRQNHASRLLRGASLRAGKLMPEYIALCLSLPPEELAARRAEYLEAVKKGARQGPGSPWPCPGIVLKRKPHKIRDHWLHMALQFPPFQLSVLRAGLELALAARRQGRTRDEALGVAVSALGRGAT